MNIQRPQHFPATNDRRIDKPVNEPSDHHGHHFRLNSTHSHNNGTQTTSCTARECPHKHTSERFGTSVYTATPTVKTQSAQRNTVTTPHPNPTTTARHTRAAQPTTRQTRRDASHRQPPTRRPRHRRHRRHIRNNTPLRTASRNIQLQLLRRHPPLTLRLKTLKHRTRLTPQTNRNPLQRSRFRIPAQHKRRLLKTQRMINHRPPPGVEWPAPGPCCESGAGLHTPSGGRDGACTPTLGSPQPASEEEEWNTCGNSP